MLPLWPPCLSSWSQESRWPQSPPSQRDGPTSVLNTCAWDRKCSRCANRCLVPPRGAPALPAPPPPMGVEGSGGRGDSSLPQRADLSQLLCSWGQAFGLTRSFPQTRQSAAAMGQEPQTPSDCRPPRSPSNGKWEPRTPGQEARGCRVLSQEGFKRIPNAKRSPPNPLHREREREESEASAGSLWK